MSRPVCPRCGNAIKQTRVKDGFSFGRMMADDASAIAVSVECSCGYESKHKYEHSGDN